MKKMISYLPIVALLFALRLMDDSLLSKIMIGLLIGIALYAKYQRKRITGNDVEYDERIEANLTKWSLRTTYFLNALLLAILFMQKSQLFSFEININTLILYIIMTLAIPFYVIPTIIKQF